MEERLEYKDKFEYVLRDDEKVLWTGAVNKKAYVWKKLWVVMAYALIPLFMISSFLFGIGLWQGLIVGPMVWLLIVLIAIPFCRKGAKNTFLCITDKQIIKRYGIIKNDIQRISLNSINEIRLITSWVDSSNPMSSTLQITTKGFGSSVSLVTIRISSLIYADEAYKLISRLNDNESTKVLKAD